jgi:hypothetical protein
MLRSIVAIVAGYIVLSLFFFVAFIAVFSMLGVDFVFQPESFAVTPLWWMFSAVIGLVGSALAGYVCAAISKSIRVCQVFAGIVFVVLILFCIPKMRDPTPRVRSGPVSTMDAMRLTQMPIWMHVLNPVLSALGVILGARMKKLP